jgi:hypothetical protein
LRVDPALLFTLCTYCNTSSFVQTKTRAVSRDVLQRHLPVIDVSGPSSGWIAGTALIVIGGLIAGAAALVGMSHARSAAPLPSTAPTAQDQEPLPSAQQPPPSIVLPENSATPPAPTQPESRGAVSAKPSALVAKNPRGRVTVGQLTVSGRLGPNVVRSVVDENNSRFRVCYEQGLSRVATLSGSFDVRFVIGRDGSVSNVAESRSDLPDAAVKQCVASAFYGLRFPTPEAGIVTVVYPLRFRPG